MNGFRILGTGSALPKQVVTNEMLTKLFDTSDEWIKTHTGISERRILKDEGLTDLACEACRRALENAGCGASEIDTVIVSTIGGDYVSPSMSCFISARLGISPAHMLDSNMACPGFTWALETADTYFRSGKTKKALVVAAEAMSRFADWTDRSNAVLFGDGAGAVVLGEGGALLGARLSFRPSEHITVWKPHGNCPFSEREEKPAFYQNGQEVYKFAVSTIAGEIAALLDEKGFSPEDVSLYLLHQANIRILESARTKLKMPPEKFPHNIERVGNTSSASTAILLDEVNRAGMLKNGDKFVICCFGAGLVTGTLLLEWNI